MDFSNYSSSEFYDALFEAKGTMRKLAKPLLNYMSDLSIKELKSRQKAAEAIFFREGVTFKSYA